MSDSISQMDIGTELRKMSCLLQLSATTKEGVLAELVDLVIRDGKIPAAERDVTLAALREREGKMSTGMQNGIAIPHGKTDVASGLVTALALKREGVEFASLDGGLSTIFVMTISRNGEAGAHIKYLAEISRLLTHENVPERLLAATDADEIRNVMLTALRESEG